MDDSAGARQEARTRLSSHPTSAAAARRFVRDVLNRWRASDREEPVLLCTDELVTNAIVHVASDIEVVVVWLAGVIRVEVHDTSTRPPLRRVASYDAESGRGLQLVEALASRWGVDAGDGGKAVWFEVQDVLVGS
ncbi:MAG TPA: ATP-binding protein [Acidimicrobiales bacterium]|nr:ATP-binding protein [Acidimicrobiales bacterium]